MSRRLKSADGVRIKPQMKFFVVLTPGPAELKSGVHRATVKDVCPKKGLVSLDLPNQAIRNPTLNYQELHSVFSYVSARVRASSLYRTAEAAREAIDTIYLRRVAHVEKQMALIRQQRAQQRRRVTSLR